MTVNEALEFILAEILYTAKREIIEKYNARDDQISPDGFSYIENGTVRFRHSLSVVTPQMVYGSLHREMIFLCYQTVPITLLESKDSAASIIRPLNHSWNIRRPAYPTAGQELDIDEVLAQISVYRALAHFGVNTHTQTAKELLNSYRETLIVPEAPAGTVSIAFRFSADGTHWHDSYMEGDKYLSIATNGIWGTPIPIGGEGGGGASSFVGLSDTPAALEAGKMLVVNSFGTAIGFADMPSASSFLALPDTPSSYVGGRFLAVNGEGNGIEFVAAPSGGGGGAEQVYGYPPTMPWDFEGRDSTKQFMSLTSSTAFSVDTKSGGLEPKMEVGVVYHLEIFPEGNVFSFGAQSGAVPMRVPLSAPVFTGAEYAILFNAIYDGDDIFIFNITTY